MNQDSPEENLLSDAERRTASDPPKVDFVEDFKTMVGLKSDAPSYGVEAAALTALSLAAADGVQMESFFDEKPQPMNVFALLVGPSTVMRKSTILGRVRSLMPINQQTQQDYLVVLDDVSTQAFNRETADAGKKEAPVLYHSDEVAGLFEVVARKNSFLAGFDKVLMKAFDHSPTHIARTNAKIENERGAFVCVFAATTPEPLMKVLSSADVKSGLLPRFIVFDLTEAARGNRLSLAERKANDEKAAEMKDDLAERLLRIAYHRAKGIPEGQTRGGEVIYRKTILSIAPDAVDRLDEMERYFDRAAFQDDALGAMAGRAFHHLLRLSGLYRLSRLTADEDLDAAEVEVYDVLRAAWLIETALLDLVRLAEKLGGDETEQKVRQVVKLLEEAQGHAVKQKTILRRLKMNVYEAKLVLGTALGQGLASSTSDGAETYWRLSDHQVAEAKVLRLTNEVDRRPLQKQAISKEVFGGNLDAEDLDAIIGKAVLTGHYELIKQKPEGRGRPAQVLQKKGGDYS